MQSVLNEITKLRSGTPIVIDYHNSNRYRLVVQENNGTKTAYYFSTPIYNWKTRKLINMKFRANGDAIYAVGRVLSSIFRKINSIKMKLRAVWTARGLPSPS